MKKVITGGAVALVIAAITLCIFAYNLGNQGLAIVGMVLGIIGFLVLILLLFGSMRGKRNTAKSFEDFYQDGDFEGGIEFYQKKYDEFPAGPQKSQCAYYLMTFYFLLNDLDKARDLFGEAEFGNLYKYALYYDILLDLYDGMVGDAKEKYETFMEGKHPELKERRDILTQIFDFIDDKIDTLNIQSDYPIIKDIAERYADMENEA